MRKLTLIPDLFLCVSLLAACSPKYNWRDYRSPDAPYVTVFPGKPSTFTRGVDLNGIKLNMTMAAVDVDGTMFAVGSAELSDPAQAAAALEAMKAALVRNIDGKVSSEKTHAAAEGQAGVSSVDVEASGIQNGAPMRLVGHFVARDKRIYQVVVIGKAKNMEREQVDMFMSSFQMN